MAADNEGNPRHYGKEISVPEQPGGHLVIGATGDLLTLSPITVGHASSWYFLSWIYEPLVEPSPDTAEPSAVLAESWEASEDGLTWLFTLRENVTWQDGQPFTALDVKTTFDLFSSAEIGKSEWQEQVTSVETPDAMTVEFSTLVASADFPLYWGIYYVMPAHILQDIDPAEHAGHAVATGSDPAVIVGTGPFIFTEWVTGDLATVVANPNYWDGEPYLSQITRQVSERPLDLLKTGAVDYTGVSAAEINQLDATDLQLFDYLTSGWRFLMMNLDPEKTDIFQDVRVRQALFYAIDRQAIIDGVYFGYADPAVGYIPSTLWAYNPDGIELKYEYDPDLASQLFDDAGWTQGGEGSRENGGRSLAFTIHVPQENDDIVLLAQVIQEQWRLVGVEATIEVVSSNELDELLGQTRDFEALMWGFSMENVDLTWLLSCAAGEPGGANGGRYCNPEVDRLLTDATTEFDSEQRLELITEMNNLVLADLPIMTLVSQRVFAAATSRLHNAYPNAITPFFNIETWWLDA
jgi:peptide/nickel transport system substrate-binding protein